MVKQIINKGDILAVLSTGKRLILYLRFFFFIQGEDDRRNVPAS